MRRQAMLVALLAALSVAADSLALPTLQGSPASTPDYASFVTRKGTQLEVDGQPFYFSGANFYSAMINAAGGERDEVTKVLQTMNALGLTVLRTWAFNDASSPKTWQGLQLEPGIFNQTVLSDGLDWVLAEAAKYSIKVILTFTSNDNSYGGVMQYLTWRGDNTTIHDFYRDSLLIEWEQNNIREIITRNNSITGVPYREDPTIFGWELINEPKVPGDDSGDLLTEWIHEMAGYAKSLDPNHLVMVGVQGFFGNSTPDSLIYNPTPPMSTPNAFVNAGNMYPYNAICEGQDFNRNHESEFIDVAMIHLYPDVMTGGNLEWQMQFSRQYIESHIQVAEELGKPLIIGEFGKVPPIASRNAFMEMLYNLVESSARSGHAIAGSLVWTLATSPQFPAYNGYDPYNVYYNGDIYLDPPIFSYVEPSSQPATDAHGQYVANWEDYVQCLNKYWTAPHSLADDAPARNDGWENTLALMQQNAAAMAALSVPSSKGPSTAPVESMSAVSVAG